MNGSGLLRFAFCLLLGACAAPREGAEFRPVSFEKLEGWQNDTLAQAIPAFLRSCAVFEKRDEEAWQAPCAAAKELVPGDDAAARAFFEEHFTPHAPINASSGLFTGYYEASLRGARMRGGDFQTPLYAAPDDMITADLTAFGVAAETEKIVGKVEGKTFVPYDDRADIAEGSLAGRAQVLVWAADPVDAFFLEIQGSGRVSLADGTEMHVGYLAQNGQPYTPIGRVLFEEGEIEPPITMAKIRAWLASHPHRAQEIMNKNASTVFFRELDADSPIGALGVVLTPQRSLAVDPRFVPLGVPVWLVSDHHQKLVLAQDTGGAIKGAVRGDLFWGHGARAEKGAGEMQEEGTYYLFLPKERAP